VVAVPDKDLRSAVRQSMTDHGVKIVRFADTVEQICEELRGGQVDLLITVPEMAGADVGAVVQHMRNSRIGENPFIIVMTLIQDPNPDVVRRVVDAGVDDVLLMPVSSLQVAGRLNNFVTGRKPFVITHDYIGPERREAEREGAGKAIKMTVPNPIRAQVIINSKDLLADQIREAKERINFQKMRSYGGYIAYMVEHLLAAYEAGDQAKLRQVAARLVLVSDDLAARVKGTPFAVASEVVLSLHALAERFARPDRTPKRDEVDILPTLSRAIQRAFEYDPTLVSWKEWAAVG
jgi:DNA-binding response OmpR family regulator